jgi:hypothetical protein
MECIHFNPCNSNKSIVVKKQTEGNDWGLHNSVENECKYFTPTADVVPKSEYDRLEKLFNDMTQEAEGYLNRIYGIRADVAMEIFAEIEKKSCLISETNHSTGSTRVVSYQISAEKLAELKKKYTEGEQYGN